MTQYEERLQQDIDEIRQTLSELAEAVEMAFSQARRVFLSQDAELAYATVLGDHHLNRESSRVDRLCHAFIARHSPSAGHLRLMSSVIRVSVALERIGDYAVTICREAMQMKRLPQGTVARELTSVGEESQRLLHEAMRTFLGADAAGARALMPMTSHVQGVMPGIYSELVEGQKVSRMDMLAEFVVFSLIKRVADQAKNICDQTVFAAAGEDKPVKQLRVLFLSEDNLGDSKLAELVANHAFSDHALYESAGQVVSEAMAPGMTTLLGKLSVDVSDVRGQTIAAMDPDLERFPIIVCLDDSVRDALEKIPFHTSVLRWDLTNGNPDASLQERYEELTRRMQALMTTVFGDHD